MARTNKCSMNNSVRAWLFKTGWQLRENPDSWVHPEIPQSTWTIPEDNENVNYKQLAHLSREGWRTSQWKELARSKRREVPELPVEYPHNRIQKTRKLLHRSKGAERFILLGAATSPAALGKTPESRQCCWSGCSELGTWNHICWECQHRPTDSPERPDNLAARWGWPTEHKTQKDILRYLTKVCSTLWTLRHPKRSAAGADPGG